LALGATVVILSDAEVRDLDRLRKAIKAFGVTSLFLSPALLQAILNLGEDRMADLAGIRAVAVTGASLTAAAAASFFQTLPHAVLVNLYGSTEIGTTALLRVMDASTDPGDRSIGTPTAHTAIYVLDENMSPVPVGATGELFVSAPHMARGYLGQPELTARKFLENPFLPGQRLYRTGDLVKWLSNGEVQFVGRTDHQVKIRGVRVELEEIEAAVAAYPSVSEAVVTGQGPEDDLRMVAYVTSRSQAELRVDELRRFVRTLLPASMIPTAFVVLAEMPRTNSGKVNRRKLPAWDPVRPELDHPFVPPQDSVQAELAAIWVEILKVKAVGIRDNFLELGGDSLAAAQAIPRIRDRLGLDVSLEQLFDRTLEEIAAYVHGK